MIPSQIDWDETYRQPIGFLTENGADILIALIPTVLYEGPGTIYGDPFDLQMISYTTAVVEFFGAIYGASATLDYDLEESNDLVNWTALNLSSGPIGPGDAACDRSVNYTASKRYVRAKFILAANGNAQATFNYEADILFS